MLSSICVTTTIFLFLAVAATNTFCHQELETQLDQASEPLTLNRKAPALRHIEKGGYYDGDDLKSWNPSTSKADFTVAKDGSGTHKTVNDALAALEETDDRKNKRVIIYVKAGVYEERVKIKKQLKNLTFIGDGIDETIVTGNRSFEDDDPDSLKTATFSVSADGFWATDITFQNTAGAEKGQGAAVRVRSDKSVFYRCSFKGYRNTLLVVSYKQFYRDCQIYGSVDTIIGNAAVVFQDNTITAHGGDRSNQNTGISIQGSRIRPAPDLVRKSSVRTFLGRPWKKYSTVVIFKTDLADTIDPKGWTKGANDSTLFYAEYENTGSGASTKDRVDWPGFHVLKSSQEVRPYTVSKSIQGDSWIPMTGVPYQSGV